MGYGIEIIGADGGGDFIVQDTDLNMINYQVTASGQASSIAQSSLQDSSNNTVARLFVNGNVSGTQSQFVATQISGGNINFVKTSFTNNGGNLENVSVSSCSVNYIILKQMNAISAAGGNYGVQLFTNTNKVAFDSRAITTNTSFVFTESRAATTVSGNYGIVSSDGDSYVDIEAMYTLILTGSYEDTASGFRWNGTGTGTAKIELLNFHNQQGRGGGNSTLTSYRSNFNTILLGKVR
tara:strand:- start:56 stop:769 length:714 start_codon:yes stop_codon:yes gene_type:complete